MKHIPVSRASVMVGVQQCSNVSTTHPEYRTKSGVNHYNKDQGEISRQFTETWITRPVKLSISPTTKKKKRISKMAANNPYCELLDLNSFRAFKLEPQSNDVFNLFS